MLPPLVVVIALALLILARILIVFLGILVVIISVFLAVLARVLVSILTLVSGFADSDFLNALFSGIDLK